MGSSLAPRSPSVWTRRAAATLALVSLAACASSDIAAPTERRLPPGPATLQGVMGAELASQRPIKPGLTPPFMVGKPISRVGLALPFATRPADAEALSNAAELALFEHGDASTLMIPRDEGADPASAEAVARGLVRDGVDVIVGPLLGSSIRGAARPARAASVPVIGFSTDRTVAGDGVYLLNYPLEDEVARIAGFAVARGLRNVALLAPDDEYGRRVEAALRRELGARGGSVSTVRLYVRTDSAADAAARALAPQARAVGAQAILIADGGSRLRNAATGLLQGGADLRRIKLLGTSEWAGPDLQREPTLAGGWYAATDPNARAVFDQRYQQAYGRPATRFASLAYDAFALSALLTRTQASGAGIRAEIERPDGYIGVDGPFRFRSDGSVERALAVLEVRPGGVTVIDAAPRGFPPASS